MNERITFEVNDTIHLNDRIIQFFKKAEFKYDESDPNSMRFYQSDSLFEAWKNNPLKWKSEIIIKTRSTNVFAEFNVDTEVQMFTIEEENVWKQFFKDFQNSICESSVVEKTFVDQLNKNKRSRFSYLIWPFIGAFTGGIIATLITKQFGNKSLVYFCIPTFATMFLKLRIMISRHHNAL